MKPILVLLTAVLNAFAQNPRNPAYAPIPDQPGLPRVLLIGSSVSVGYTLPTRKLLEGKANVHRIPVMAGTTSNILLHIDEWLGNSKWDLIHFTFGLRDPQRMEDGAQQVAPPIYEQNVGLIVKRLKATGARLIWASATPVPEGDLKPVRKLEDVLAYDAAARRIMIANGVAVNDLYAFALPRLKEIQLPANVHFTAQGYQALGEQVAAAILKELGRRTGAGASRSRGGTTCCAVIFRTGNAHGAGDIAAEAA